MILTRGMQNDPYLNKPTMRYRVYVNAIIGSLAKSLPGGFCCVGVSWGITPRVVFDYCNLGEKDKPYYLMDKWDQTYGSNSTVKSDVFCGDFNFITSEFFEPNFKIIRDHAPKGFSKIKGQLSYLHFNLDNSNVEANSLKEVWDIITTPGFIVLDNYSHGQKNQESFNKFFQEKNILPLPLPSGQCIIIKL